jgi:hypothetical protein
MCTTFLNVILQNVQINTLQNLQNVNNAQNAKCKQCSGCKMCSLSRLQNVNNAAAWVRPGFGSVRIGFAPLIYGPLPRSPGRPVLGNAPRVRSGRPCGTVCQSAKRPSIGHGPYRCARNGVRLRSQRQQSRPGSTQSHPEPLSTLDLLGLSPIAAGIAQLLTACVVAALWAIALADWLTADQPRQICLLASCGHSQASISRRLGVSRYRVRKVLA